MPFTGSSCGKFILMGEHFVVVGEPALAFPLKELRCEVSLAPGPLPRYLTDVEGMHDLEVIRNLMSRAIYAAVSALRLDPTRQAFEIRSKSNFPISHGLGSSAAFAVALVRALDSYRKANFANVGSATLDELLNAISAVEKVFHGSPSGIDAATIFGERPLRFQGGKLVRDLKNSAVDFVLADGGPRELCTELIERVTQFRENQKAQWNNMAEHLRNQVDACEAGLRSGDARAVAKAVTENHAILSELGLSTPRIEAVIQDALSCGALAGKVSGAGGGGAVVLVTPAGHGDLFAKKMTEKGHRVHACSKAGYNG